MIEWPSEKRMGNKKVKGVRLIVAAFIILFVLFVAARIFFEESKNISPGFVLSPTLLFTLWILISLFGITFLFILVRNMVKMYYDRHQQGRGHSFKNRLVFFFISFSIVPTLLLFFFATDIVSRSVDRWFRSPIESIMTQVKEVEQGYYEKAREDLAHFSRLVAEETRTRRLYTKENRTFLQNTLKAKMLEYNLDVLSFYISQKEEFTLFNPRIPMQEYKNLPTNVVYRGLGGESFLQVDPLKRGELVRTGVAFDGEHGDRVLMIVGLYFPEGYIHSLRNLSGMANNYSQQKNLRDPVKNTYILLFIFITILIIFSASWIGFYLARGITTPIEKLAAAASEITKGNLDVQIDHSGSDEFRVLTEEFSRMAVALKENRDKLSKRTAELRHRRSVIETILNNITSGVIAIAPHGEIVNLNPEAARVLSLDPGESIHKPYAQAIGLETHREIHDLIGKALETKFKLIEREVDLKVKGRIVNLAVRVTQIRQAGTNRFAGVLVVLTDLSDLIKAQRMLVWREVARRVAHEIKNPLTPIQISSQRIMRSLELPDEKFRQIVEDSLNVILEELDSIKRLAEEFGNFARLPEIKFTQGDINEILEKLASVYSSVYQGVVFNVSLSEDLPQMVRFDIEQIRRVFVNILDNAVESMNKEGTIEVHTRFNAENRFVTIEIADSGPGISDEDKGKLFIPYFSKKHTGRGLGLAIVSTIIEEHNGLISVVDNHPTGARFIIELPA